MRFTACPYTSTGPGGITSMVRVIRLTRANANMARLLGAQRTGRKEQLLRVGLHAE